MLVGLLVAVALVNLLDGLIYVGYRGTDWRDGSQISWPGYCRVLYWDISVFCEILLVFFLVEGSKV